MASGDLQKVGKETAVRDRLHLPVIELYGVGPERAGLLARLEIKTVEGLLLHAPRRYEDRREFRRISGVALGETVTTRGMVLACGVKWFAHHTKSVFELILDDGSGRLHLRWWNVPFLEKQFEKGMELVVSGKIGHLKPTRMDHPEVEVVGPEERFLNVGRITPIYPLTEGLSQRWLRGLIWRTLGDYGRHFAEQRPGAPGVPAGVPAGTNLPTRQEAVEWLHFPEQMEQIERARRRLALDEFIELQWQIRQRRRNFEQKARGIPIAGSNALVRPFLGRLGFKLTAAQTEVLRELRRDLEGRHPMRRLLQGDVGSGKTVVAACCALMVLESGYNAALMAPTEILAEQHYENFRRWLEGLPVHVELWTGSRKPDRTGAPIGGNTLFIGTHALVEPSFDAGRLGLVIIDEQHKFGVSQREQLVRQGEYPHLLVMTATPIPRTLGLTLYGDLDISTIRHLPPGRGELCTYVREPASLPKVWDFVRKKLAEGRQAYIVYPRIEETTGGVKAVLVEHEKVSAHLAPSRLGLLHGRLRSAEKEDVMAAFRTGALQALLATPLIEVGVDVSNASVMVIENAEQFGLSQLHQLRGRIGRGAHKSHCILVSSVRTPEARQRLSVLEKTNDGFAVAEADLALRGPGEFLGEAQSGAPKFRFADLARDFDLVKTARDLVAAGPRGSG